jgi:Fe-S cluster assembly protein SufB
LLIGKTSSANTFPYVEAQNSYTQIEHEASTSRIAEEQSFYLLQRGIETEEAVSLMVNGFCKEVFNELPLEFASEADRLLSLKLEGSVG